MKHDWKLIYHQKILCRNDLQDIILIFQHINGTTLLILICASPSVALHCLVGFSGYKKNPIWQRCLEHFLPTESACGLDFHTF